MAISASEREEEEQSPQDQPDQSSSHQPAHPYLSDLFFFPTTWRERISHAAPRIARFTDDYH
jgi:hypothetical protein